MNVILLSGGSGKRLWPLSNDVRSKQFLKIFRKNAKDGATGEEQYESMVQRVYRQIKAVDADATVTIATSKSQVSALQNQLGGNVGLSVEPCRRDTFPAMALAAAYLRDVKGIDEDEAVVVCPVDPYVDEEYFRTIRELWKLAEEGCAKLVLMGIDPTYPSEKYGYVMPASKERLSKVETFQEKPDLETAKKYVAAGALWNGGVFACKLGYLLEKMRELTGYSTYAELYRNFEMVKKISFDYAVAEREKDVAVLRFAGSWKDLGTWNTLTEAMEERTIGNAVMNETCENVHVVNELGIPILAMGLKNIVIAASPDGILVSDKEQSSFIKPYVDAMNQQVMYAEKSWGSFRVLDEKAESLTILVTLNSGHGMNYHAHERRDEVWTVIEGSGRAILDGEIREVRQGDVIKIPVGVKHSIIAQTPLRLIEVQMGKDVTVSDKIKYPMPKA